MAEKVLFELVSPEKLLLSTPVDMVVVPGGAGDFGVLPGHAPMVSTVRAGVIDIYEQEKVVDRLFISGGFAEVTSETCTVLAEEALPLADLDLVTVEQELNDAREDVEDAVNDDERAAAQAKVDMLEAKLEAAHGILN